MRLLDILRVLLPSWQFFDDVAGSPTLLIRCGAKDGELSPWQTVSLASPRKTGSLFIHPRGNLALAHHTLLEHLLSDVAELDDRLDADAAADAVPLLVSYRLVTRLARAQLATQGELFGPPHAPQRRFQFKLTVFPDAPRDRQHDAGRDAEDLLISRLHDA